MAAQKLLGSVLVLLLALHTQAVVQVFQLNQLTSFRSDQANRVLGCVQPHTTEFMVGTYIRRVGACDTMNTILSPYTQQVSIGCLSGRKLYGLVFGPDEDYDKLMNESPEAVAQAITTSLTSKFEPIIHWHYPLAQKSASEIERSKTFLRKLLSALQNKAILRVPATSVCFLVGSEESYITGIREMTGLIVEMYGRGSNYMTYDSHFEKMTYPSNEANYKEGCPSSPSLLKLNALFSNIKVYIAKPLRQSTRGFVWDFSSQVANATSAGISIQKVFYDGYQQNMIRQ